MSVFDPEFYPTPKDVIQRMLKPYAERLDTAIILEPSAGNGAILDTLTDSGVTHERALRNGMIFTDKAKARKNRVYAIERDPELKMILQTKGYRVIASDFLSYTPEHRVNLIVMNPPFKTGDRHLLHAWEILQGGDIVCLLNAETIRNPYTATRKRLASIIESNGSVEYIGQVFRSADNPTNVEVALVRLSKDTKEDPFDIDARAFTREKAPNFGSLSREGDQLAVNSQLDAYIRCWNLTKAAAIDLIKSFARLKFFAQSLLPEGERGTNILEHTMKTLSDLRYSRDSMAAVYNDFLDTTKTSAWNTIFQQIGLEKYMTTGLRRKLDLFREAQGCVEISKDNIMELFRFIMANISNIMDQSVVEVYDLMTSFFKGNTISGEGWKTNKRFHCNRKVIIPNAADAGYKPQVYGYDSHFNASWQTQAKLDDIDKAMCWLTGKDFNTLFSARFSRSGARGESDATYTIATALGTIPVGDQKWHESAFFRVKAFKKGTVHLEFKDEALWKRFNLAVNEGKNQIGMAE